jgi:hypothetical protein
MTIEIQAHMVNGRTIHKYAATDVANAGAYMAEQAKAPFVDGYSVGGFGIVTVHRSCDSLAGVHFGWLDGAEFQHGDGATLSEALRKRLYALRTHN